MKDSIKKIIEESIKNLNNLDFSTEKGRKEVLDKIQGSIGSAKVAVKKLVAEKINQRLTREE